MGTPHDPIKGARHTLLLSLADLCHTGQSGITKVVL